MLQSPRRYSNKRSGGAELVYLVLVLAAGVATAWWAAHILALDLSSVTGAASMLGLTDTAPLTHRAAGFQPDAHGQANQPAPAPYCGPGEIPTFGPRLAAVRQRLGDAMGAPTECEHTVSAVGDTIQQTTTGLVAYTR